MPLRVLIIPDKFKGTLTAAAAAEAIARGWRKARAGDSLSLLPMSDGGDGFGEVTSAVLKARIQRVRTVDAAHRPCWANWWWEPRTRTAIIESAAVIGLAMLPPKRFHPFQLDTLGLGKAVRAAAKKGARRCLQPGFDLFARQAALERRLRTADLVVTGEGAIDRSTLMGKGVGQIARRCRHLKIPCIGLAGMVSAGPSTGALFAQAHAMRELTTVAQAKARPAYWLERLAQQTARRKSEFLRSEQR